MNPKKFFSDFLVLGTGIAGLSFAIKAAQIGTVTVVTKKQDFESNTNFAQGGIASVLSPDDSFEKHIEDTLEAGAGLCNRKAVEILVKNGPERIMELMDWGTRFSVKKGSASRKSLDLGREGGHSLNRIAHATDLTGREIEMALLKKISSLDNVNLLEDHTAVDLLTEHQLHTRTKKKNGTGCYGAYILNNMTGDVHTFNAKIILIATGGTGQVYLHTTNPTIATGDGIAMAYRAGAQIADMEFIQFHPTSFYSRKKQGGPLFLISEAVRGEGGILLNSRGRRFMEGVHPRAELAPRDIVARAIDSELKSLGDQHVYLDISFKGKEFLKHRFPNIYKKCKEEGIDISTDPIPVVPAAHYLCGGIVCDTDGKTPIRNLYVSGEASCTGVHGANRLASNSLLEGVVFSHTAFENARSRLAAEKIETPDFPYWNKKGTFDLREWILVQHNIEDVKRLMWDYVGIVRTDMRLKMAYKRIMMLAEEVHDYYRKSTLTSKMAELRNLATVAKLIIRSAMARKDSIGLHFNIDHPKTERKKYHIILSTANKSGLIKKHE
ncbi:MAG: L-aspartate oxidase [Spirochaetes bacterium]|jgi:L-aspartate oxidase|nr:L-aspartate oxidase [Spirochaetota bacterium]